MALVNEQFAAALRARLNGKSESILAECDGRCGLAHARQAEVSAETISQATAEVLGVGYCQSLREHPVSHEFVSAVPIGFARRYCMAMAFGGLPIGVPRPPMLAANGTASRMALR